MATLKYKDPNTNTWKSLSGYIQLGTDVPIGAICEYASDDIPDGYLPCNGQSLSKTDYPELYSKIGDKYGNVDSTHFNLPNIEERVVVGKSSSSPYDILGKTGGEERHTLTVNEMPVHNHLSRAIVPGTASGFGDGFVGLTNSYSQDPNFSTANSGGGKAHNNMQPYIVLNYIIKAKSSSYTLSKVIDNLDSNSSTDALSANQGKVLNEKINKLVKTYILASDANAFTIDGLDIQRDGGIYDIDIQFQQSITNATAVILNINNITSNNYDYAGIAVIGDRAPSQQYMKQTGFYRLGALRGNYTAFCRLTIAEHQYSYTRFALDSSMFSEGNALDFEHITGQLTTTGNPNLTSITIACSKSTEKFIAGGTQVRIYKR